MVLVCCLLLQSMHALWGLLPPGHRRGVYVFWGAESVHRPCALTVRLECVGQEETMHFMLNTPICFVPSLMKQQNSSPAYKAPSGCGAGKWGKLTFEQQLVFSGSHACTLCPATAMLSCASQGCDAVSSWLHTLENFPSEVRTAVKWIQSNELLFLVAFHIRNRSGTQTSRWSWASAAVESCCNRA